MSKERLKGIGIGLVMCAAIFAGVMMVSAQTLMRSITYGVRVNLHGQELHFSDDMRPFLMDGRTFLPVRAISEVLELPVDFDTATNTVYLGNRFVRQRTSLQQAAPFHRQLVNATWGSIEAPRSIRMVGTTYYDVITFPVVGDGREVFTEHNLHGQFTMLTGYVGTTDEGVNWQTTLYIYGDGALLDSYEVISGNVPIPISVFVEGIQILRIEFRSSHNWGGTAHNVLHGFLE